MLMLWLVSKMDIAHEQTIDTGSLTNKLVASFFFFSVPPSFLLCVFLCLRLAVCRPPPSALRPPPAPA
jgi:hypothetical protein